MKKIALVLSLFLTGCGVTEQLGRNCGGDLKELCYNVFGGRTDTQQDSTIDHHQTEIDYLQRQIDTLNSQLTFLHSQSDAMYADMTSQISALNSALAALQVATGDQVQDLQTQVDALNASVTALQGSLSTLQTQSNATLIQLATIQNYVNIVDVYDPCGTQGSWNEVFLHTSDGRYIASFSDNSNGQNTRFTVLQDGSYVTTDGTHCYFTVSGGGTVISGEHN